mmetsp:Transcript_9924/g.23298  ORF Transcript_9924/g.23298 Transcript_9924/m.23298 type:complete len:221 (-) Transcript_9924:2500-3162(-)
MFDGQGQARPDLAVNRRKMRGSELPPQAGGVVAAVAHADAGAADHGVQAVACHELGQRAPERDDRTATAVIRLHTGATDLGDACTQGPQPRQVELGVAVEPAGALGRCGSQHPVGADDWPDVAILAGCADEQVLTVGIEEIDIQAGWRALGRGQARAHLDSEDLIAQRLGLAYLGFAASPADRQRRGGSASLAACMGCMRQRMRDDVLTAAHGAHAGWTV